MYSLLFYNKGGKLDFSLEVPALFGSERFEPTAPVVGRFADRT